MAELTNNMNFLQPTNFKVVIDRKQFGNLEFFAQRVSHPSVTVTSPNVAFRRISTISIPGDTISFSELSFDVIVDEDLKSYTEVYEWISSLVDTPYREDRRSRSDISPQVDITLTIQNSHNNTTKKIRYKDCVPTSLGVLTMESVLGDTPTVTFPVSFTVEYFDLVD
jgi:hypothetical protein